MRVLRIIGCCLAPATLIFPLQAQPTADPSACVALITTDRGRGTGFVCEFGGTNYLVTNAHVLEGAQQFEFRTINGTTLKAIRLELANDRDLARVLIDNPQHPSLRINADQPKIG